MESKASLRDISRAGSPVLPIHSRPASPFPRKAKHNYPPSPTKQRHSSRSSSRNPPLLSKRTQLYVTRGAAVFLLLLGVLTFTLLMHSAELVNRSGRKSKYPFPHHIELKPPPDSSIQDEDEDEVVSADPSSKPGLGVPETMLWNWGQYGAYILLVKEFNQADTALVKAPWMPASEYIPPPIGCAVSQVGYGCALSPLPL